MGTGVQEQRVTGGKGCRGTGVPVWDTRVQGYRYSHSPHTPIPGVHISCTTPSSYSRALIVRQSECRHTQHLHASMTHIILQPRTTPGTPPSAFAYPCTPTGVAFNVRLTSLLQEVLRRPIHVPAAPDDYGLPIGYAWAAQPPTHKVACPPFVGPSVNFTGWETAVQQLNLTSRPLNMLTAAEALVSGKVLGIISGRQEYGTQGLGHRTLVAVPDAQARLWACTPFDNIFGRFVLVLREGDVPDVLNEPLVSPYARFTGTLRPRIARRYPNITWPNGRIVVQTISPAVNPTLHELLTRMAPAWPTPLLLSAPWRCPPFP